MYQASVNQWAAQTEEDNPLPRVRSWGLRMHTTAFLMELPLPVLHKH